MTMRGYASSTLLSTYEVERIPVIADMLKITTDLYNRTMESNIQREIAVQKAVKAAQQLNDSERSPWHRGRKLFQLDVNYRWSPVVVDERFMDAEMACDAYGSIGHDVRAGDRASDAPELKIVHGTTSGQTTRLFDIFSPASHTVLLFGSNDLNTFKSSLDIIRSLPRELFKVMFVLAPGATAQGDLDTVDFVVEDTKGLAKVGYGLEDTTTPLVILIRPDAMVGAVATSEHGVDKYVRAVFSRV